MNLIIHYYVRKALESNCRYNASSFIYPTGEELIHFPRVSSTNLGDKLSEVISEGVNPLQLSCLFVDYPGFYPS